MSVNAASNVMPSQGSTVENIESLDKLKNILDSQTHLFTCGGIIPINNPGRPGPAPQSNVKVRETQALDSLTIRWDGSGVSGGQTPTGYKLTLPIEPTHGPDLIRLVEDSEKATFGRGGQDVYDETYRKALQMDPRTFCTTFDPYSMGIIDIIAQVLLPSAIESTTHRAVHAELYKLNVYSGPSGKFRPHVDTPRSPFQFGSLVVCLPVEHTGGQLKVRHKGQEMTFDWSNKRDDPDHGSIRWAAFYSDCQHEVFEVTAGHRLTLTYNLFAVQGAGRLTGVSRTLNPVQLPLFQAIKGTLEQDPFNGQGGTLGFWCSHVYAYNNVAEAPLPETLKGVDAVLWESFQALHLQPKIAPVMRMDSDVRDDFEWCYEERYPNVYTYHGLLPMPSKLPSEFIIGREFGISISENGEIDGVERYNDLFLSWGEYAPGKIHWLTKPTASELQLAYVAYGNNASLGTMYSNCAILVTIPPRQG